MPDSADPLSSQTPQEPSAAAANPDPDMPPRKNKLKKPLTGKLRAAAEERLAHLRDHLRLRALESPPGPLAPPHEAALRALGLLDFARLDLHSDPPRPDLVAQFIAYYDPSNHRSFVHGTRIGVSRSEFASELSLPSKPAASTAPPADVDPASVVSAVLELMQASVLPPFQGDDMCILPQEVAAAEQAVRDGSAHRVDWAGLIWGLVEKEILELPKRDDGVCYYGPYIQKFIWAKKPVLFLSVEGEERGDVVPEVSGYMDIDDDDEDIKSKSLETESGDANADARSKILEESELDGADSKGNSLEKLESGDSDAHPRSNILEESELKVANLRSNSMEELESVDVDVRGKSMNDSELEDEDAYAKSKRLETLRSNSMEELESVDVDVRSKSMNDSELEDEDAYAKSKRLETLELVDEDARGMSLDESEAAGKGLSLDGPEAADEAAKGETLDELGLGFVAMERVSVMHEVTTANDEDVAEVTREGHEDTAVGAEEKHALPLVETLVVTQEEVLAVPEDDEEADEEEENEATGLSLGVSSATDYDNMDVEDNASVENDEEDDEEVLGFVAMERVSVMHEVTTANDEDAAEVTREGHEDTAVGAEEKHALPLVETLVVTQEEVLAVPEDDEEADDEEADEEEENEATGLSLGVSSATDYDNMDVEDNASVENLDDSDSANEEGEESDDGFDDYRGGEEMNWRLGDEKEDEGMTHCLQQCNTSAFPGMEFENLNKGHVAMRDELSFGDGFSGKLGPLHGMASTNLLQGINSIPETYNGAGHAHDLSSGEFLAMGADAHNNGVGMGAGSSFLYGNNGKRHIADIGGYNDHMQAQEQFPQGNQQKRMRNSNSSSISSGEFNATISEPMQDLVLRASMFYERKEKELREVLSDKQRLANELQMKESAIQALNSARFEQENLWQAELKRFEHDLNLMGQLVIGYKKALKQTRSSFDEYRKKFPCEKPRYADVVGGGGLVLTVKELERKRLEEEQQKLAAANEMIEKFNQEWVSKYDDWNQVIICLLSRVEGLSKETDLLKEKRKAKVTTPPTEE